MESECNDSRTARNPHAGGCLEEYVLVRICYALPPEDGPFDGSIVPDCEYQHNSLTYIPLAEATAVGSEVEIVVRGRFDAYVHAGEVTRGCSNCYGKPYGMAGLRGFESHTCNKVEFDAMFGLYHLLKSSVDSSCFGLPRRRIQAIGLAFSGFGMTFLGMIRPEVPKTIIVSRMHWFALAGIVFLIAASVDLGYGWFKSMLIMVVFLIVSFLTLPGRSVQRQVVDHEGASLRHPSQSVT